MPYLGYASIDYGAKAPNMGLSKKARKKLRKAKRLAKKLARIEQHQTATEYGRKGKHYWHWQRRIFARDKYTCRECKIKGEDITLHAHHIKWWSKYPVLRFKMDNGLTLCRDCHIRIHPWLDWIRYKQLVLLPVKPQVVVRKKEGA